MSKEPDDHDTEQPLAWFDIHEGGAPTKKWTLLLYRDVIELEPKDGRPYVIYRDEVPERVQKFDSGLFMRNAIMVTLGKKNIVFQLSPDAFSAVNAWIGPPTDEDLKAALKRRLKWVTPIGLLFVLGALPVGEMDWEPVSLTLGLGLILTARLAKLWPHRNFFLIDALWFGCLAANTVWLLTQEWGWLRLFLLAVQLLCVRGAWREYRRFAPEKMKGAEEAWHERDERAIDARITLIARIGNLSFGLIRVTPCQPWSHFFGSNSEFH